MALKKLHKSILILIGILSINAYADGRQFHLRSGLIKGSYSGPVNSSFSTFPSIELEAELFFSSKVSTIIKSIFAMDFGKAKVFYSGVAGGQRFYFSGPSLYFSRSEGDFEIQSYSPHRFFGGYEVGVSQVLVQEFTSAFSVVGSVAEFTGTFGYNYQLNETLGLELVTSFGYGFGFTTVAVNGFNMRFTGGVSYYF